MVKGSTELSLCPQVAAHWDLGLIKGWWVLPRSPPASQLSSVPSTSYALGMNSECQSRGDGAAMGSVPTDPRRSPSTPHAHVQLAGAGPVPQPHSCPPPPPPSPASVPNHSVIPIHSGEHPLPTPPATKCLCFSKVWVLSTCLYPCIPHVRHKPRADSIPKGSGERIRAAVLSLGPAPKAASLPRAPTPSTAPVCCPQCQQGDGVVVCMKLAKVRAAVRGAGCVNAIF